MTTREIEDLYPLSPMQQGMLFHSIYSPESGEYLEQLTCSLVGSLDTLAFEQAWQEVVRRHTILRTSFIWEDLDEPLQVVHRQVYLPVEIIDWRGKQAADQSAELVEFALNDLKIGFDLLVAPLMRVTLIRRSEDLYHFIWTHHHLLLDGWSMPVLLQEVFSFYEARVQGKPLNLRPTRPFRDYIAWLKQQNLEQAEAFWRENLHGFEAPNPIVGVSHKVVKSEQNIDPKIHQISLGLEATQTLRKQSQQLGLTINTWAQAAWALLLSRYTGEKDVLFGATVAGRPATLPGSDSMLGLFINTLPVRAKISGDRSVIEWLKELQSEQAKSRQYEYSPLVQIQSWSEIPSSDPLFDSILVFENYPVEASLMEQRGSLVIRDVQHFGKTNYPLTLVIAPGPELQIQLVYDPGRFESSSIRRMAEHFIQIMVGFLADTNQPVKMVRMLTPQEEQQFVDWNLDLSADQESIDVDVVSLFTKQVGRTPKAEALIFAALDGTKQKLSYDELDNHIDELAARLIRLGANSDTLIGVLFEKSLEMVIALFAVLKIGAGYVPLDPKYPTERLIFMIQDSGLKFLLTQAKQVDDLANKLGFVPGEGESLLDQIRVCSVSNTAHPQADVRNFDSDGRSPNRLSLVDPRLSPAYVIYTSGSTGIPKGVMVPRSALANHALRLRDIMELQPGSRMGQMISLSFDAAGEEIYPTLISGGTLVIPPPSLDINGKNILDFCADLEINFLHLPVPLWNSIVDEVELMNLTIPSSVQGLLVGGESPSISRFRLWTDHVVKPMIFINAYGPTEATITSTTYKLKIGVGENTAELSLLSEASNLPIGKSIPGARILILDPDGHPTPIGVPGEIYIAGAGLALGYLNRPEITTEKFLPLDRLWIDTTQSPYPQLSKTKTVYYRTGDLGYYLEDGNIMFAGRVDHQVKLRGYRIELEEIDAVLNQSPEISEGIVILREDHPGDKRLVAYLTLYASHQFSDNFTPANNLKSFLKERLPDYMIPSGFVILDELPHLPNGKIDRRALARMPAPEKTLVAGTDYIAPRDTFEEIVAGLWQDILGIVSPSINDNFFDLGGHSLKATQLLSRLRQTFQIEIMLRSLFEAPTIAGMAAVVRLALSGGVEQLSPIVSIARDGTTGLPIQPPPLSFSQQRLWFLNQLDPGNLSLNIPASVRITGKLNVEVLEDSLNQLVKRHEALRTVFTLLDGNPVQNIIPELKIPLNIDELQDGEAMYPEWVRDQVRMPFDLDHGPLLRARLLRLNPEVHILLVTIHHIVSDGWSMGILIKEIATLYELNGIRKKDLVEQTTIPALPQLTLQYADYAAWQRNWLSGDELERQLSFWKDKLAGLPPLLDLPTDRPRPAVKTSNGALESFQLTNELAVLTQSLANQEGVTGYMLMLAAFQTLLFRYTGQDDISVGSAIANRTRPELEGIIGFFVNTLVLRTDLSGDPGFRDVLHRVREYALEAYAHQDLPFEMLVEALQPERNMSYTPLFQVGFDLQEVPVKNLEMPGLALSPIAAHAGSAAFDMLMSINQSPGQISGSLEFNTDLFDRSTIQRFLGHFEQLLQSIVEDANTPITKLVLMTAAERRLLLMEWNQSVSPFADNLCVHQLFEGHVANQPDAVAAEFTGIDAVTRRLTYAELDQRADAVADHLVRQGVGPDVLVGISVERSLEMIVGILGILKAGGAYLPLDPNYPVDRLAFMIDDSQIKIILSQQNVIARLNNILPPTLTVINLESDLNFLTSEYSLPADNQSSTFKRLPVGPDNLAYVIYTSGSTGRPKGTLLRHRGLCNLVEWQRKTFEIDSSSVILQFSPFSFDASVWETFMALANGGRLCLAAQDILANGIELIRLLKNQQITTVTLPPSVLSVLPSDQINSQALPALRTVIAAGEACSREIVDRWAPGRRFFDAYGPTETTVCASAGQVQADDLRDPPIGRPISNTQLYILDKGLQPAPIGVPGELFIGGVGVAKGYLNRPDLTAEKFIPAASVFQNVGMSEVRNLATKNQTLYRTGDLVRYRVDGNVEFLGRIDEQVKIRGYRIELGEIESTLRQFMETLPDSDGKQLRLRESAVVIREDGDKRLVAFVVPEIVEMHSPEAAGGFVGSQIADPSTAELIGMLRRYLRQSLPEYMVPSNFVILESLPLSPSGKIDRRLLATQPLERVARDQSRVSYQAPTTETEIQLCHICADLLGLEWDDNKSPIGVQDNFFELGGHSLLATQFVSRIRDQFSVELPLRTLFAHPTVGELAGEVETMQRSGIGPQAPVIRAVSRDARKMRQTAVGLVADSNKGKSNDG